MRGTPLLFGERIWRYGARLFRRDNTGFRLLVIALKVGLFGALQAQSQSAVPIGTAGPAQALPRVTQPVDDTLRISLEGNIHPLAQPQFDLGPEPDSFAAGSTFLLLRRSADREAELRRYIEDLHNPASANFHKWLSPAQIGVLYGPADSDVQMVIGWLQSHSIAVNSVNQARTFIKFSGTAWQIRDAFRTSIHRYSVNGEIHHANQTNPEIPSALAPVIAGIASMNDFYARPALASGGRFTYDPRTNRAEPLWTYPIGEATVPWRLVLSPGDFNTQYNIPSGATGAGITIGIIGLSGVDFNLLKAYRSLFGLDTTNLPTTIVDGNDPGVTNDDNATEAYLDLEVSGAVAPSATINDYIASSSALSDGLIGAALRAVEDNSASVLSMSYLECEPNLGSAGNQAWNQVWEQAAAQGQTVMVSSGDSGSASCDNHFTATEATFGLAVNGRGSTPFNISVGGTDFYYSEYSSGNQTTINDQIAGYWNLSTTTSPDVSLLKTVPEQVWNRPFGLNVADFGVYPVTDPPLIDSGGGGMSSCAVWSLGAGGGTSCSGYPKPSWQYGIGVPADQVRDLPDVSLYASNSGNYSFYPICASSGDCTLTNTEGTGGAIHVTGEGGTSASSPAFAGIMALVDQATGSRQGQANYVLYALATQYPSVFNDVTVGSNNVPCIEGTPNCSLSTRKGDPSDGYYSIGSYYATAGYDLASGLGSVNVANLLADWTKVTFAPTTTLLSSSASSFQHGTAVTLSATVSGSSGTPTGNVALISSLAGPNANGLAPLTLNNGSATQTLNSLPGGNYSIYARYGGDGSFAPSNSNPVNFTVSPENSLTNLAVVEYLENSTQYSPVSNGASYPYGVVFRATGRPVGVNAVASGSDGTPTGTVDFTDSFINANSGPLRINSQGYAVWFTSIGSAVGSHTIAAEYSGDNSFNASSSATPITLTIFKASPTATLTLDATSYNLGQTATLRATLDTTSAYHAPTGTVTFYVGGVEIGIPVALTSGTDASGYAESTASLPPMTLPAGTDSISFTYSGDFNFTSATAQSVVVTVSSPSFSIAATPVTISKVGGSGSSTITVTPSGGFTGKVDLTCSLTSSPTGARTADNPTCNLPSSVMIAGTVPAATSATFSTTSSSGSLTYPISKPSTRTVLACGLGLPSVFLALWVRRRRHWAITVLMLLIMLSVITLSVGACSKNPETTQGAYTFTITGKDDATGQITSSVSIALTVP